MMGDFVRIRVWHEVLTPTRMFNTYRTLCEQTVTTLDTRNEVPPAERLCKECGRRAARRDAASNG